MTKRKFNISDWQQQNNLSDYNRTDRVDNQIKLQINNNDTELIIQRLEAQYLDITSNYGDWRDIGFAFSDEFGELGRDYFHKVSRFHPDYSYQECDKQYNKCLKASGHGVTIKTFFHLAQQAGISLRTTILSSSPTLGEVPEGRRGKRPDTVSNSVDLEVEEITFNTPQIPSNIYSNLPEILKETTDMFSDAIEKDVFLLGAISVLSACLPNIQGIYFDEPVTAHLYSFITAPAGSGKGKLKWAKYLAQSIHKSMVESSILEKEEYERELEQYNNLTKNQRKSAERPKEPKRKMFFIPANSSSSAFIQALADNDFKGLIFETEADTLAGTLKQDWGNFSDVLRKAFHHESTNMFRRKDNEHIEIDDPHLAIALSGTPKQVHNMMPDTENGLFSRFLYYAFEDYSDFKNPFISHNSVNYVDFFKEKGEQIFELYKMLNQLSKPLNFEFTSGQAESFTQSFKELFIRNKLFLGNDFNANSRRLGLITFRIAMVLTALRILENGNISSPQVCDQTDYQTALNIAFTLEKHAIAVFKNLPNNQLKGVKLQFFEALPKEFNRQDYLTVAMELEIKEKTAEKYLTQFRKAGLLNHEHNKYSKVKNEM
jgi:hypothetical protein